ncbi:MAG: sigma-70 family RNA polymerase sigma factor [Candidatus Pristimantibacillus sp.]
MEVMRLDKHYLQHLTPGNDRNVILEDLMNEFGNDIWNFAFFLTRKSEVADDIAQDVFLAVYERMYTFRGECSIKSWLLTITRNKSMSYLKSSFIRKVKLMEAIVHQNTAPSAESELFDRQAAREVWEAVMSLPVKFREVIVLDFHYGLPIKEIASMLQLSEGTVKSRSYRARNKLTRLLEHVKELSR